MKPHEMIAPWKGDKRLGEMARRAAALKKDGGSAEQIVVAITAEFGPPPQIQTLRDAPGPFTVYGEIGTDIEPGAVAQLEMAMRLPVAVRGYCWQTPSQRQAYDATGAKRAKAEVRVRACGSSASQAATRSRFSAAATSTCISRVLASPM